MNDSSLGSYKKALFLFVFVFIMNKDAIFCSELFHVIAKIPLCSTHGKSFYITLVISYLFSSKFHLCPVEGALS